MPPSLESVRTAFPHLEIIALIGSGGMGAVFKARQPQLDRFVALKILPTELAEQPGFSERFQREAQALAKLSHPHIVTIHDFGSVVQSSGLPSDESRGRNHLYCLLMEFVDGSRIRSSRFLAFICLGLIVSFQKPIFAVETIRLKSDRGAATVGAWLPLGVGVCSSELVEKVRGVKTHIQN